MADIAADASDFVITGLSNDIDNEYFIRVAARNADDRGVWAMFPAGAEGLQPGDQPAGPVLGLSVVQSSADEITVRWSAPADSEDQSDVTGYVAQIRRAANQTGDFDGDATNDDTSIDIFSEWLPEQSTFSTPDEGLPEFEVLTALPTTTTSIMWDELVEGVKYEVRVFAQNTVQTGLTNAAIEGYMNPGHGKRYPRRGR